MFALQSRKLACCSNYYNDSRLISIYAAKMLTELFYNAIKTNFIRPENLMEVKTS